MHSPSEGTLPGTDHLWPATLQRIAGRAAHELKGALNGVAVNLEVVRSRALGEADGSSYSRFANNAAGQLENVIQMTESLLGLTREARQPADVAVVARQMASLLGPVARAKGSELSFSVEGPGSLSTTAFPSAVRLAIGEALLGALEAAGDVAMTCGGGRNEDGNGPGVWVRVRPAQMRLDLDAALHSALTEAGVAVKTDGHGIFMQFPVDSGNSTEVI